MINDKVIHVSATAADTFSTAKSLVVAESPAFTSWKMKEDQGKVVIETAAMKAYADIKTGEVVFKDLNIDDKLDGKKEVIVNIPTDKPATYNWSCGMDMFHGKVVVK